MIKEEWRETFVELLLKLARYGYARDRATERALRVITITDDEAIMLLEALETMYHPLRERFGPDGP